MGSRDTKIRNFASSRFLARSDDSGSISNRFGCGFHYWRTRNGCVAGTCQSNSPCLLREFANLGGKGVAAPSANRFGHVSPTTAEAVQDEIGEFLLEGDLILDGGSALVGIESTIIDCTSESPRILRLGAITKEMIEESTGLSLSQELNENIRVSGSLENHYSPKATVVLDVLAESGEGFIAPASIVTPQGAIRLAAPSSTDEYARLLYAALRLADEKGLEKIAVIQPTGDGLAEAIRDRLLRASRGR